MSHIREVPEAWRNFLSLEDTPSDYSGLAGQFLRANVGNDGLEFTDDVLNKSGGTMTGALTLHSSSPASDLEAASKGYVDSVAQGLDFKESVVVATTANITLANEQTIDGVAVTAGQRVLVKSQTDAEDNGIYLVVDGGAWTRSEDADSDELVTSGMFCFVEQGTINGDTGWVLTTEDPITVGTTELAFTQFSGAGTYTAGEGLVLDGTEFKADWETNVGNIEDLGTASLGSSTKVARSDHVHAHGDQLGGTLHANATALLAGFMSSADFIKLDGIEAGAQVNQNAYAHFTDGSVTTDAGTVQDTFKYRAGTYVSLVLTSNDATHGDNLVVDVNWAVLLEALQDDFGNNFIQDSDTLTWTYNDGTPSLSAQVNVDGTTIEIDAGNNYIQVKDGVFAPVTHTHVPADITGFDEAAQDAVGGILTDTNSIDLTYDDSGGTITADVLHDTMLEITAAGLRVVNNTYAPYSHVGSNGVSQHAVATGLVAGFMSAADWTKLDGIETGAQVNQDAFSTVLVGGTASLVADSASATLNINGANVVSLTGTPATDTLTIGLTAGVNGQFLSTVAGVPTWANLPTIVDEFTDLTDTPGSYAGAANYRVKVNSTPDALEFVDDTFLTLNDTPASYATFGSKFVKVNAGATALEFVDAGVVPVTANANETLYWNGSAWTASGNIYNDHTNSEVGVKTQSPNSTLHVNGTYAGKRVTITASKDLGSDAEGDSQFILVNNTSAVTVTLPPAADVEGRTYYIKKISSTGGANGKVTIDGNLAETIDGDTTAEIKNQYEALMVVSNGTNWFIF
jgi:hypothetical protein